MRSQSQPEPVNGKRNGAYAPQCRCGASPAGSRFGHRGGNKKGDPPQSGRINEATNRNWMIVKRTVVMQKDASNINQFLNELAVYGTSLARGSIQQQTDRLEHLIDTLTDIDCQDKKGRTLLSIAVQQYKPTVVKLLLEKGANPNIEDYLGVPPLSLVFLKQTKNTEEIIKLLLQYGADPTLGKTPKHTPLYYAKLTGSPQNQVELLQTAEAKLCSNSQINDSKEQ